MSDALSVREALEIAAREDAQTFRVVTRKDHLTATPADPLPRLHRTPAKDHDPRGINRPQLGSVRLDPGITRKRRDAWDRASRTRIKRQRMAITIYEGCSPGETVLARSNGRYGIEYREVTLLDPATATNVRVTSRKRHRQTVKQAKVEQTYADKLAVASATQADFE